MRRFFTLCCVFATLAAGVCAQGGGSRRNARTPAQAPAPPPLKHGGKIETSYDGFAHETVVELKRMSVTCESAKAAAGIVRGLCVSLRVTLHCPGRQVEYVRRATVRLTFESKDWDARHPPNERDLSAVADGETVRLGRMTLAAHGVSESWLAEDSKETLELSVPYDAFLKLVRADHVELSVGKTTFALRDKNIAALRDMNARVKPPRVQAGGGN
ncbi:MAG TPA: hypothetical protein VF570_22010 [Pyrinomonadaceae bacterium]|jgi:hypothetical protein